MEKNERPGLHPKTRCTPTLGWVEASPRARALAEEIVNLIKPEELYGVAQKFLDEERDDALRHSPLLGLLDPDCTCHFDDEALMLCEKHTAELLLDNSENPALKR